MKAITLWQPWASLLATEAKQYETRSWATKYRGLIAIHAAKKNPISLLKKLFPLGAWSYHPDFAAKHTFLKTIMQPLFPEKITNSENYEYLDELKNLPRGCIIATAELVGCWEIAADPSGPFICRPHMADGKEFNHVVKGNELLFGNWTPGRYAWELTNIQLLSEPIPAKGYQGLWNWKGQSI